jgi:RHS repeat-associated protein
LVAPESSYNELTVLAAKQRTAEVFPLAALAALDDGGSLPETRVMGLPAGNQTGIGGCWPVTSTLVWGSEYRCDGTASGRLVGLDYGDHRMYASTYGRFNTPDPFQGKAKGAGDPGTPGSWNKYEYTLGDPVNNVDPQGTFLPIPCDPSLCPFGNGLGLGWDWGPPCTPLVIDPGGCVLPLPTGPVEAPPKPPSCESGLSQRDISYVSNNFFAAFSVGVSTGDALSADFILAWAAVESGFGTSNISKSNDNFFGETSPKGNPNQAAPWNGAVPCAQTGVATANPNFACFAGSTLAASASAALSERNGLYLTVASIFRFSSVATIAQAIANAGWCSTDACKNGGYGAQVQKDYNELVPVVNCLFPWEQATQ